ncbi:MAG: TolC family protein [Anaeromyxobacter sp.]
MKNLKVLAGAIALASGAVAGAAEVAPEHPLAWSEIEAALERDPRVSAAQARASAADASVSAAGAIPNPELELAAGHAQAREGGDAGGEWELAVTLPLDWLARRGPAVDAARAGADEARAGREALRAEVRVALWTLFVEAGHAQTELSTLVATAQQVEALAGLVRRRVEAGEGRPIEITRTEAELERVRAEVAAAQASQDQALAALGAWLGGPVGSVAPAPSLPELPPAEADGLARHPRVRAALARAAGAQADAVGAHRARLPAFSVGAYRASELDRDAVGGRLTLELPLWNWKGGEVRRAEALAQAAAAEAEAERRAVEAERASAAAACRRARDSAGRQEKSVLPLAESAARTLERTFQLGEVGLLDVLDARRVLLDARREALSSARERDLVCGALHLLAGQDLP